MVWKRKRPVHPASQQRADGGPCGQERPPDELSAGRGGQRMGAVGLILIRHGESEGNVAASAAQASGAEVIDVRLRDPDVPLSPTGREQASALKEWLAGASPSDSPDAIWCSPYLRARQTAELAGLQAVSGHLMDFAGIHIDERLRDRELGILDMLTARGVAVRFPEEARRREWLGKFYYRPPGGESWADVALRLRSLLAELDQVEDGHSVALICHDAVIMLFRYICEGLTEEELLAIAASSTILNCSVTRLVRPFGAGPWRLESFNEVAHLKAVGAPVTEHRGDTDVLPH